MKLIDLDTLLRQIIFHIIPLNIPFVFCLAVIDKYEIFFNNIINQVIQSQIWLA